MEQINYEKLLPAQPRADVVGLALEAGVFTDSYLLYRSDRRVLPLEDRTEDAVRVTCTACGTSFLADKVRAGGCHAAWTPAPFGWRSPTEHRGVISGQDQRCPCCGKRGTALHAGSIRTYGGEVVDDAWVTEVLRLPAEGRRDRLAILEWCVRRCIDKAAQTRYEVWPYTAFVVEEKKVVRLMGYLKTMGGAISLFGEWRQRKTFANADKGLGMLAPWDPALLEGTTAKHCKLDGYIAAGGKDPAGYLALWRRHPAVENLVVQGCGKLVAAWMGEETSAWGYSGGVPKLPEVNWKERQPARMLGLNREEFGHLRREGWSAEDLARYKLVRDAGVGVKLPEDLDRLRGFRTDELEEILKERPGGDFWRVLRYLRRQQREWTLLRDYWRMSGRLGRDLTDNLVRWPRDLLLAHDRVTEEQKARKEKALQEKFQARYRRLEPLSLQLGELLIRPCRDQGELIAEGKALHHCVASYAKDHAGGKTAIFFIRRQDKPQEPYFTLELDEKRRIVRQNRGLRNCDPPEEVQKFVIQWLNWIRKGEKKTA